MHSGLWLLTALIVGIWIVLSFLLYSRNLIHITYLFLGTLLLGGAWFMVFDMHTAAASQIMIYAGGVLIVMLFGVMLTQGYVKVESKVSKRHRFTSLLVWLTFTMVFGFLLLYYPISLPIYSEKADLTGKALAAHWMHAQLFPFELSAILLLLCLVGAVYISSTSKQS